MQGTLKKAVNTQPVHKDEDRVFVGVRSPEEVESRRAAEQERREAERAQRRPVFLPGGGGCDW